MTTLRTAAVLGLNALHECIVPKGAETQVSDAMRALRSAIDADLSATQPEGFQARYRIPDGEWSSWGHVVCGVKGHEQELRVATDRASPSRADGWMDIASAPKDGTDVILSNGVTVAQGHWLHAEGGITEHRDADGRYIGQDEHDGFDGWIDWSGGMLPEPTLWMPVPAAPGSATVPAAVDVGAAQAETAQAAATWCQCPACAPVLHASDCAVHNAPALPVGPCDCGAASGMLLLPREATKGMMVAAVKFANGPAVYKNVASAALDIEESIYGETWGAMVAAATANTPPQGDAHGTE